MRDLLGWSTGQVARAIRTIAAELDDKVELSQQTVSAFENGQHKSNPRWLGYAQIAIIKEMQARELVDGRVWYLKIPTTSRRFFQNQRKRAGTETPQDEFLPLREAGDVGKVGNSETPLRDDHPLTSDEVELLGLFRSIEPKEKAAIMTLVRSIATNARSPTVHDKGLGFRSLGPNRQTERRGGKNDRPGARGRDA
ncbi:hypothetical protein PYV00_21630 [Novosphingobium sp. H3SJ31-1]|uniref:XRE family transcriptional regulator n=2 Tax=Novosphingobium album (ex Liu et al. 2023) TaxID=3031130 RepID=A0ABT5WWQ4_9SPHN|nr:hypothetical protein [Novosphingobium album (ex Liu et al. 2023)]